MKQTLAVGFRRQCLLVFLLVLGLQPAAATSAQPVGQDPAAIRAAAVAAPAPPAVSAAGCQWTYYPIQGGALQPPQTLYNDPANTPIADISTGNVFQGASAHLAARGSTDFNADNKTDVFRTALRPDGNLQWQYSSGGTGAWQNLAYAGPELPASALQFGAFDGNFKTDVFASVYGSGAYHWVYSPDGTASFVTLHSGNFADRLALGDFNADGVTDVFTASAQGGTEQWGYFPGGSGPVVPLAFAGTDPALLRFGDFNGDGKTDVFAGSLLGDGSTQWQYSSGGVASYANLVTTTVPYSELQFGDFNGDGKTDVLAALPQNDGGLQVVYWPGGLGAAVTLGHVAAPAPALRVGDFNGDGIDDLLALRCGMSAPLAFGPLQTLANSGYGTFFHSLLGDVNGDGWQDVILVSTCQNQNSFAICAGHHLQVGAGLGTPSHTFTLVAPQQLSADDFTYAKALAGDFDGDGKTDVALIIANGSSLTLYVARSNGDGHFTMGAPQTFGGESDWGSFNPIVGDFNGDGHDDLAFTTVCNTVALFAGSCTNGNSNRVYLATSSGAGVFSLGARQDLAPTPIWASYYAFAGDFNGDGKTDLVFNSTCQKNNSIDSTCTAGDANDVYTALSIGHGGFTLSGQQNHGSSGWRDYPVSADLVGDVNGDGRSDLVWSSTYQAAGPTHNNLVAAGLANPDGSFQLSATQDFSNTWTGSLSLADLNRDGKADLVWNNAPLNDTDVDTYAAAMSKGDGTFNTLGRGAVYTSRGYFGLPQDDAAGRVPTSLTILSTRQNSISSALFVVDGGLRLIYLPIVKR
jgi:FG-GAP-like repeat